MLATFATSALLGCAVAVEFNTATFSDHQYDNLLYTLKGNPDISKQLLQAVADAHGYEDVKFYDPEPLENYGHFGPIFYHEDLSDSDVYHESSEHFGHHDSFDDHYGHHSLHDSYDDHDNYTYLSYPSHHDSYGHISHDNYYGHHSSHDSDNDYYGHHSSHDSHH